MLKVFNEFERNGVKITEYTKDGLTVSHTVRAPIQQETERIEPQPTIEEQILVENQYQTALLEMNMMGAM